MHRHLVLLLAVSSVLLSQGCSDALTDSESTLTDLPELESIAFGALGEGKLAFERIHRNGAENSMSGLYVIDVDGRTTYGTGGRSFDGPSLSPDGRRVAYSRTRPYHRDEPTTYWDIYMSNMDGSEEQRLTDLSGDETSPAWLSDGQHIVFYERHESGVRFYRQPLNDDAAERELIHTLPETECSFVEGHISVSSDGALAFSGRFCGDATSQGIYSIPMDGGPVTNIAASPGITSEGAVRLLSPSWSPDGRFLAYLEVLNGTASGDRTFLRTEVKRMDADGDSVATLVSLEAQGNGDWAASNTISLAWSPDGTKIAFNHRVGELTSHIYVIGSDGEGLQQITSAPGASDISISWSQ